MRRQATLLKILLGADAHGSRCDGSQPVRVKVRVRVRLRLSVSARVRVRVRVGVRVRVRVRVRRPCALQRRRGASHAAAELGRLQNVAAPCEDGMV